MTKIGQDPWPLGMSTSVLPRRALPDGLRYLADPHIPWIEVHGYSAKEFDFGNHYLVAAMKKAIDRFGLQVWSCHSPAYDPLDLASTDGALRQRTYGVVRDAMEASMELEPRVFVCDAVGPPQESDASSARWAPYAESLHGLLDKATQLGVRLAIENHTGKEGLFVTPDDFSGLVATYRLDGLRACWDTGHGWITGQPPEVAGRLGPHLVALHVHDNNGRKDQHRLPMTGSVPWSGFMEGLVRARYDGPLMMELVPPDPCTPEAIRDLANEAIETHRRLTVAARCQRSSQLQS